MCRINFLLEYKFGTYSAYVIPKVVVKLPFPYYNRIKIMHKTKPLKRRTIHVAIEKAT